MKNAKKGITLKSLIIIIIDIIIPVAIVTIFLDQLLLNKQNDEWKKVNLGKSYYETEAIEIDLDGDNVNEKVTLNKSGKYITINEVDYVINKYVNEGYADSRFRDYNINQYNIVDLNGDGILEIIHKTFSDMISPIRNKYTIYNFKNNQLIEVGKISISGTIPNEIYVKENYIKFEYWPYESPKEYMEKVELMLDI